MFSVTFTHSLRIVSLRIEQEEMLLEETKSLDSPYTYNARQ